MKTLSTLLAVALTVCAGTVMADEYSDTTDLFRNAGQSASYFDKSYGYAVFPTIAKGGLVVGAAHGDGRVYEHRNHVGDASVTQVSVGLQAGGQAFSEIVFFEDKRAFDEFTSGQYSLDASVGAVAITAAAGATAGTGGTMGGASGDKKDAVTAGGYHKGVAVFTVAKGGLMYEASVGGQKFSYKPKK